MADKKWKSLWGNYEAEKDTDEAKKPRGPRPNPDYQSIEDEGDERGPIGFHTEKSDGYSSYGDYAADDRAGSDYGGYGYSGYSYSESFDDSDMDWYRRNSFRYGRNVDYSPSSLFRSTFSSRTSFAYGTDSDAQNKAVRALRNLTRSANTIVDKAGQNKTSFAVQFSQGSDSNGVTDSLNDNKQRVVFVSPDDLLASDTAEAEDAIVDALTGFVLLRVQISQDITPEVLGPINGTGLQLIGFHAAKEFFANDAKFSKLDAKKMALATTEYYLAGMLAKSMLTRLARRTVVSDWGGFAPYFVRHAKKFITVRENLEKAEPSLEAIVGRLAYNMIADEDPLDIPEQVAELASKHLGAEVEPANLLETCQQLVHDISDLLRKENEDAPAGDIENALQDMFKQAQEEQSKTSTGAGAMKDMLTSLGEGMGDIAEQQRDGTAKSNEQEESLARAGGKARGEQSIEQLIKAIKALDKQLESAKADCASPHLTDAAKRSSVDTLRHQVAYALQARPQAIEALARTGVEEVREFVPKLDKLHAELMGTAPTEKDVEKVESLLADLVKKAKEAAKTAHGPNKKEVQDAIHGAKTHFEAQREKFVEIQAKLEKLRNDVAAGPELHGEKVCAVALINKLIEGVASYINSIKDNLPRIEHSENLVAECRTSDKLVSQLNAVRSVMSALNSRAAHTFYDNYELHTSVLLRNLVRELSQAMQHDELPKSAAVPVAVENTMGHEAISDVGFLAQLLETLSGGFLSKLSGLEPQERRDAIAAPRLDLDTMEKLIRALNALRGSSKDSSAAEKTGRDATEKMGDARAAFSPVDGGLFGEKVEAKTRVLTGDAIGHVNDEASNAQEEEYVAYLNNSDSTKPKARVREESSRLGDSQKTVQIIRTKNKNAIARIRSALQFQAGRRSVEVHGLLSGDLDEGSLHKLGYDCEHIWSQKTISKLPDVAVGLLVDQSGSMAGSKITSARDICIMLAEAVRKIAGVRLYVYGHTANEFGADSMTIFEHYTPRDGENLTKLGGIRAHSNNYDGYAIKDVAKRLSEDQAKKKYLFVIADGLPAGSGYGGETAEKHVTSVCKFTRERLKISTYAFAVGVHGSQQNAFKRQYGDKHVVFVNDVAKCLPQIVRFLRNAMQQERKLVGVAD
jgi:hypothetical protein